jgi:hypothetical protein
MKNGPISIEEQEFKMKRLPFLTIIFIGLSLSVSGCAPKTNKIKKANTTSTNPFGTGTDTGTTPAGYPTFPTAEVITTHPDPYQSNQCGANSGMEGGGVGYGTGNEAGYADANPPQTIEYVKVNDPLIIAHGTGTGVVQWSSQTDLSPSISQSIFYTDQRMNIRVVPRAIQQGASDTRTGASCAYIPRPYQKLKVTVRVRRADLSSGYVFTFGSVDLDNNGQGDGVPLNKASRVHEFQVPQGSSAPLVIEVMNIEWDYSCYEYETQNYCDVPGSCPWGSVWTSECVGVELQFSTDGTKDLVGERTN